MNLEPSSVNNYYNRVSACKKGAGARLGGGVLGASPAVGEYLCIYLERHRILPSDELYHKHGGTVP